MSWREARVKWREALKRDSCRGGELEGGKEGGMEGGKEGEKVTWRIDAIA